MKRLKSTPPQFRVIIAMLMLALAVPLHAQPANEEPADDATGDESTDNDTDSGERAGPVTLQWGAVQGAAGYRIQVSKPDGEIVVEKTTTEARTVLQLPPGEFRIRVASLDRFYRASQWSGWAPLNVQRSVPPRLNRITTSGEGIDPPNIIIVGTPFFRQTRVRVSKNGAELPVSESRLDNNKNLVVTMALGSRLQPGAYEVEVINPGNKSARSELRILSEDEQEQIAVNQETTAQPEDPLPEPGAWFGGFYWTSLVPGLPEYRDGNYVTGTAWLGTFLAMIAFSSNQAQAANSTVASQENDFFYQVLNDPVYALAYSQTTNVDTNEFIQLYVLSQLNRSSLEPSYSLAAGNYYIAGGAAILIWLSHIFLYYDGGSLLDGSESVFDSNPRASIQSVYFQNPLNSNDKINGMQLTIQF
ncbi:MAG: hypothetical protein KDK34_05735 [Leptospiraceae bacterium]|nr:hypothetical protein [Leptospiraceae bacterium]